MKLLLRPGCGGKRIASTRSWATTPSPFLLDKARAATLVRDPIGERPLFYAMRSGRVAFASTPRGLLAVRSLATGLDLRELAEVAAGSRPAGTSYFDGITKVQPGECITFTPHGPRSNDIGSHPLSRFIWEKANEYVEAFREVLTTSVASRFRRVRGPICWDLSSGLDSSAVAATAGTSPDRLLHLLQLPREGFDTAAPRLRFADESELARLTAQMNGFEHVVVRPSGAGLSRMREMIRANQDPYYNYVNLGWIADVGDAIHETGGLVGLTGEYGNLTLHAGGIRILGDLITHGQWRKWLQEARLTSKNRHVRWRGILINSFENLFPEP